MESWQSAMVDANGVRLHYTRTGGDKPPVVLAHGITDDGLCWTPVAEALAPDYDVVMTDARGHGRSEAPEHGYGSDLQAGDLADLIQALGLERPAVLGHSMGAATALVLAGTYPDVPGAILLEDPPAWWARSADSPAEIRRRADMRERFINDKGKTRDELLAERRAGEPQWSEAELQPWADAKLRFSLNVLDLLQPGAAAQVNWPATLRRITCPALLITADPVLGAIVTEEDAAALRTLVPHLRIAHVAGAGHSIRREQCDRYMAVVHASLAEWSAARSSSEGVRTERR